MKKIVKGLLLFATAIVSLTGCRDDAELADPGTPGHPEQEVTGTYSGVWSVTANDKTNTYDGTITFAPGNEAYVTNITALCPETNVEISSPANIVKQSAEYKFFNDIASNPSGCTFSGGVSPEGSAYMDFKITIREGRKSTTYSYNFVGKK